MNEFPPPGKTGSDLGSSGVEPQVAVAEEAEVLAVLDGKLIPIRFWAPGDDSFDGMRVESA